MWNQHTFPLFSLEGKGQMLIQNTSKAELAAESHVCRKVRIIQPELRAQFRSQHLDSKHVRSSSKTPGPE